MFNVKLIYRPEIDGLRAIAVVAVILYHAQITIFDSQPFKGGFIGVDIFFVISGYLITSIIFKELITTGSFSFKHFYERRVRRILPALLVVMLVSLPFAWMYLLPNSFVDFSKSILYSLGFSSNFYFHYSGQQYNAESGLFKPFLHTWSLSVEEQFYIFFPLIALLAFKYFRKYLINILIFGFLLSLSLADWSSKNYQSISFYFLHTRLWELLAGSILAYYETIKDYRNKKIRYSLFYPKVGFTLIILNIIFFKDYFNHPSFYTLISIIGVCLIIWFSNKEEFITKMLSTKLFVGIGLISYSLYLWHYPIFAFFRINDFSKNFENLLYTGLVLLILSITSYLFIEKPFRDKQKKFRIIFSVNIFFLFLLAILNFNIIFNDGYKKRIFSDDIKIKELFVYSYRDSIYFETNFNYDNYDNRKNALIVGNSHAEDMLKILTKTNLAKKIYFNLASSKIRDEDTNFQLFDFNKFLKNKDILIDSKKYKKEFYDHLKKQYNKSELILLATRYSNEDLKILDELINLLLKDNKKILIFDNALVQTNKEGISINRLFNYVQKNKKFPDKKSLNLIERRMFLDLKNLNDLNSRIRIIAEKNNIPLIERKRIFCNLAKKICPSITKEYHNIYWDPEHITDKGAEFFSRIIEKDIEFQEYLNSTLNIQ